MFEMTMRLFVILALWGINGANAALHSLTYITTTSSEVPNLPEYVVVGLVDDVPFYRYDSNSRRVDLKQDWMTRLTDDDPQYLEQETQYCRNNLQVSKINIRVAKERFNQTGGVHIVQLMKGCEWDDETGEVRGQYQFAYDGEDFLSFDLKTLTWIAANQQAVITKHKWDNNEGLKKQKQHYLTQTCPEWLKKYLDYGKSFLLRTELPSVSLLQKTPSSPIVCHATGFYPPRAMLFWTKDGEETHEDVDIGEVLPNPDGTFQMMAELKLSDPSEDWERYQCVFQIDGVKKDLLTKLDKKAILTNRKPDLTVPIWVWVLIAVVVVGVVVTAVVVVGVVKCRRGGKSPETSSNTSEEVLEPLKATTEGPAHDLKCSEVEHQDEDPAVET